MKLHNMEFHLDVLDIEGHALYHCSEVDLSVL